MNIKKTLANLVLAGTLAFGIPQYGKAIPIQNPSFENTDSFGSPIGWNFRNSYMASEIIKYVHSDDLWTTDGEKALAIGPTQSGNYQYYHGEWAGVEQIIEVIGDTIEIDVNKLHITQEWDYEGWIRARIILGGDTLWESPHQPREPMQPPLSTIEHLSLDVLKYYGGNYNLQLQVYHDDGGMPPGGGLARGWYNDNLAWGPSVQFDNVYFSNRKNVSDSSSTMNLIGLAILGLASLKKFYKK